MKNIAFSKKEWALSLIKQTIPEFRIKFEKFVVPINSHRMNYRLNQCEMIRPSG